MLMEKENTGVGIYSNSFGRFETMRTDPGRIEIYSVISDATGTVGRQTGRDSFDVGETSLKVPNIFGQVIRLGVGFQDRQPYGEVNELVIFVGAQHVASVVERVEADMFATYLASTSDLPVRTGLVGHFIASDAEFDNSGALTQWNDLSGLGNHAHVVKGSIYRSDVSNPPGAAVRLGAGTGTRPFLYGDINAGIQFPTTVMHGDDPNTVMDESLDEYTLFHFARYFSPDGAMPIRQRIFNGVKNNWLSGFWSGRSGLAYHCSWITKSSLDHGNVWVLSSDRRTDYRSQGEQRTEGTPTGCQRQLSINFSDDNSESSDWAVAEVRREGRTS